MIYVICALAQTLGDSGEPRARQLELVTGGHPPEVAGSEPYLLRTGVTPSASWRLHVRLISSGALKDAAGASMICRVPGQRERHRHLYSDENGVIGLPLNEVPDCYLVWHRYGARLTIGPTRVHPRGDAVVDLPPAGAIIVEYPGVEGEATVQVVPGAEVSGAGDEMLTFRGNSGRALCDGIPASWGLVKVRVVVGENLLGEADSRVEEGHDVEVVVKPIANGSIRGVVVDENGRAIEGVFVVAVPEDGYLAPTRQRMSETGPDGSFLLAAVAPVKMRVSCTKRGFAGTTIALDCGSDSELNLGQIVLTLGGRISGKVVPPLGVALEELQSRYPRLIVGCAPVSGVADIVSRSERLTARASTRPARDGSFVMSGLAPNTYSVFVAEEGIGGAWSGTIVHLGKEDVSGLALEIAKRRVWHCDILGGEGLPGFDEVRAVGHLGSWFSTSKVAGGREAELLVCDGPFLVAVRIGTAVRWVHLSSGMTERESINIPSGSMTVEGLDLSSAGDLAMSGVFLTYCEGQMRREYLPLRMFCSTLTRDDSAGLNVPFLLPGRYQLEIVAPNWGRRRLSFDLMPGERASRIWSAQLR